MKSKLVLTAASLAIVAASVAQAEAPVKVEPQVGVSVTHHFGARTLAPATEFGFRFNYGDTYADIYRPFLPDSRPSLLELNFTRDGMSALNLYGVNALQPKYALNQEEGGGLLSSINWGLVGMVVLAGGIYYASEEYRDDREEDRRRAEEGGSSGAGGSSGGAGGAGGSSGGGATPISGQCLPGDPTGQLCAP